MPLKYSHPSDKRARFCCDDASQLPPWAVDVEQVEGPLNWFGEKAHPTDALLHWTETDVAGASARLRAAWDALESAGMLAPARLLIDAARQSGSLDAADDAAGADI